MACKQDTPSSPTLSVPILTTVNVSSITVATAQSGGNITSADQRSQRVAYVGVQHQHPQLQTIKQPMTQESVILLAILPVYQPILPIT